MRILFVLLLMSVAACEKAGDPRLPSVEDVAGDRHPRVIDEAEARRLFMSGLVDKYPDADRAHVVLCGRLDRFRWRCAGQVTIGRVQVAHAGFVVGTVEPDVITRSLVSP